ncbi:MAG: DegV family protein [Lachnospiraceae bacterium]|nr:DegV family protein [Lachnospiraceae bacterium]
MIRLLIDSSSDFTAEERKERNLAYVPLSITFDTETFKDGIDITQDDFYKKLVSESTFPKTAQPSPEAFLNEFNKAKEAGDEIIAILLSSSLSGTYQSANIAKDMCDYDKIYLVDSLSATAIVDTMVDYAIKLINEGKSAPEIVEALEDLRSRTTIYIGLDTLEYLYKGGRLNRATAAIGEIANLKPSVSVNREGSVVMYKKSIGKNKAIATIVNSIAANEPDPEFPFYTLYTLNTDNCEKLQAKIEKAGFKVKAMKHLGCTIGAHLGPNIYGVGYIAKKPQEL